MFSYSWVKTYCVILANAVDSLPLQRVASFFTLWVLRVIKCQRVHFSSSLSLVDPDCLACKTVANVMQIEAVQVLSLSLLFGTLRSLC